MRVLVFKNVFTLLKTYFLLLSQEVISKCFQKRGGMVLVLTPYPYKK